MTSPGSDPAKPHARGLGAWATGTIGLILAAVFAVEGGYVNDPRDPGGETNHGVTKQVAVDNGYTGPMRDLTKDQAATIYIENYIRKPGFMPIVDIDPAVAEELVDSAVNLGPARPSRWFQASINELNNGALPIAVDGKVGPGTVAAFKQVRLSVGPVVTCRLMLDKLDTRQAAEYRRLAKADPRFNRFLKGWLRNRVGNVDRRLCLKVAA